MATYKSNDLLKGAGEAGSSFVINVTRLWALRMLMLYAFGKYTDFGPTVRSGLKYCSERNTFSPKQIT